MKHDWDWSKQTEDLGLLKNSSRTTLLLLLMQWRESWKRLCIDRDEETYYNIGVYIYTHGRYNKALFSLRKILDFATVALSFVCGKYYLIID